MDPAKHRIVYLSHGGEKFYVQARFSVLTLLGLLLQQQRRDVQIVVYTDRPEEAPVHALIRPIQIEPDDLARFRGPLDSVHRIRLEVLHRAETEIGLPFIFVDSDTRWLKLPDDQFNRLAANALRENGARRPFYMHTREEAISTTFFAPYLRLLHGNRGRLAEWGLPADPPWVMWNAGTIGVPAGAEGFFKKILSINDELLLATGLRTYIDQLTLSLVANSQFDLRAFDDCLAHYWPFSYQLPIFLRGFFSALPPDASVEEQAERCASFPLSERDLEQIPAADGFRRWRARMRRSLFKRRGDARAWWLRTTRSR